MKVLLDSNVYITALRSEAERARFRSSFFPLLPATVLSAVVAYELCERGERAHSRSVRRVHRAHGARRPRGDADLQ
jgi:hypothetical protein